MCAVLERHGFAGGKLTRLSATSALPLESAVVVDTPAVGNLFGSSLAASHAPEVLASFGSGGGLVDVRVIAPGGAAAYQAALGKDVQLRKAGGRFLLASREVEASAAAKAQLAAGEVDTRILEVITAVAAQYPIDVIGFGDLARGASPDVPLRSADLAETDAAAGMPSAKYIQALLTVLRAQPPPYLPASAQTVHLPGGLTVLRIEFTAPSPLGLLTGSH